MLMTVLGRVVPGTIRVLGLCHLIQEPLLLRIVPGEVVGNNHLGGSAIPDYVVLRKTAIVESGYELAVDGICGHQAALGSAECV